MKQIHLISHTELGDLLVMQGMVNSLVRAGYGVIYNIQHAYIPSAEELFDGCNKIMWNGVDKQYKTLPDTHPAADRAIRLGYFAEEVVERGRGSLNGPGLLSFDKVGWDREFYRQADVPFLNRWTLSNVVAPFHAVKQLDYKDQVLVHDDAEHRITDVANAVRIHPVDGRSLFTWMKAITLAKQVHCIDTSTVSLIESMYSNGLFKGARVPELYLHKNVRKSAPPTLLAPWRIIL